MVQHIGVLKTSRATVNDWGEIVKGKRAFKDRKFLADGVMSFTFKDGAFIDITLCEKEEEGVVIEAVLTTEDGRIVPCTITPKRVDSVLVGTYTAEIEDVSYELTVVVPRNQGPVARGRGRGNPAE
jgi:hypothetical protein